MGPRRSKRHLKVCHKFWREGDFAAHRANHWRCAHFIDVDHQFVAHPCHFGGANFKDILACAQGAFAPIGHRETSAGPVSGHVDTAVVARGLAT